MSLGIVAATLALILARPRGISEAWFAVAGAVAMIVAGPLTARDVPAVLRETADVLVFLAGMMVLTVIVEGSGLFAYLAEGCARLARGSGVALLCLVFALGAAVTALLSLDVTVIVLTPIIYAVTTRRRLNALPFMFACTFVANTSSLLLPMSNLTNLLLYHELKLSFAEFVERMWLPNLAAVITNLLVFLWIFRAHIPRRFETPVLPPLPRPDWWFIWATITLASVLAGLILLGIQEQPLAPAAAAGAILLFGSGWLVRRVAPRKVLHEVSWTVLVFVVGMLLVVRGFERGALDQLAIRPPHNAWWALVAGTVGTAFGSNIVNNVPAALLAIPIVERAAGPARQALAFGVIAGANIGPILTTYGSLATMLWLTLIRKRGLDVTTRDYMRVGVMTMPLVLCAALLAMWGMTS